MKGMLLPIKDAACHGCNSPFFLHSGIDFSIVLSAKGGNTL
jgi:hypothetical protein